MIPNGELNDRILEKIRQIQQGNTGATQPPPDVMPPTPAKVMTGQIRISPEHMQLGRKILMSVELPQGALARYERDTQVRSYIPHKSDRD